MTYPDKPGAQAHSETSREAAMRFDPSTYYGRILDKLNLVGAHGLTCDDISLQMDVEQSTIGARLRELELKGGVVKTAQKRKTRYNRNAFVYVTKDNWHEGMGKATVKEKPIDIIQLEAEHARMKQALERIADDDFANSCELYVIANEALGKVRA